MGRSPFYAEYVRPVTPKPVLQDLDMAFSSIFKIGDVAFYDDTHVATIHKPLYIRIMKSEHCRLPMLERSCSIYRKMEDYFPKKENIYQVRAAIRHRFRNHYSGGKVFEYNVLEIVNVDNDYYTTFCIKTDGAILNIESLSLRGYIQETRIAPSIEQLYVG